MKTNELNKHQEYYSKTASFYESWHCSNKEDSHFLALNYLISQIAFYRIESILDLGSGTGRALLFLKEKLPNIKIIGIEPVRELRDIGIQNGLKDTELIDGDATQLSFSNQTFDLVCAFGMLHHVSQPNKVIAEMLRVSKKFVFISDSNFFAEGPLLKRYIKYFIYQLGLWKPYQYLRTKGKGYYFSEHDGYHYAYSVFENYRLIRQNCDQVYLLNTSDSNTNFIQTANHVALLGIKNSIASSL